MLQNEDQNILNPEQISRPQTKQSTKAEISSQRSCITFGEDITNNKKDEPAPCAGFTLQKVSEPPANFAMAPISTRATERPDQAQLCQAFDALSLNDGKQRTNKGFSEARQAEIRQLFRERLEKETVSSGMLPVDKADLGD